MINVVKPLLTPRSVLVLIDMQTGFEAAKDEATIEACKTLLQEFKQQKLPILFLRYGLEIFSVDEKYGHGRILPVLTKIVKGYPLVKTLTKHVDSGATHIDNYLGCHDAYLHLGGANRFFLGGVNTSACVLATAKGLKSIGFKDIFVVPAACNDELSWSFSEKSFKKDGIGIVA